MTTAHDRTTAWRAAQASLLCAALFACGGGGGSGGGGPVPDLTLEAAFGGLSFSKPVKLVQHPTDDARWYVVEQGGKIWTFLDTDPAGTLTKALDLVVSPGINLGSGGEQGLLGLAFDPDFATSGKLYITYTDETAQKSILARYQSPDADGPFTPTADPIVLAIPHNANNHNGGDILFGPNDDMLYYSMGDGADSSTSQSTSALLGKVLRLDVLDPPASGEKYAVPTTNPFYDGGTHPFCDAAGTSPAVPAQRCPELYAYGFRNPWRMSFDLDTGALWLGDVGESKQEEIDLVRPGLNYGWDCKEGELDHNTGASCTAPGLVFEPPEVVHNRDFAQAITGGVVYRGSLIPDLVGFYVYGDFVLKRFYAFDVGGTGDPVSLGLPQKAVSAFGQGRDGEVYVVSFDSPSLYQVVPAP